VVKDAGCLLNGSEHFERAHCLYIEGFTVHQGPEVKHFEPLKKILLISVKHWEPHSGAA
jgi:hypothetical protein